MSRAARAPLGASALVATWRGVRRRHPQGHQHPDRPLAQLRQQRRRAHHHVQAERHHLRRGADRRVGLGDHRRQVLAPGPRRRRAREEGVLPRRRRHRVPHRLRGRHPRPATTTSRCSSTASRPACAKSASSPDLLRKLRRMSEPAAMPCPTCGAAIEGPLLRRLRREAGHRPRLLGARTSPSTSSRASPTSISSRCGR